MPTLDVGQGEARIYGYGEISQPRLFLNRMFLFGGGIAAADARALLDRAIGVGCSVCLTAGSPAFLSREKKASREVRTGEGEETP